ncbi:tandem-95 repeat protein, partial [uncultured Nisaea sp.]|uniref:beta strand repeat-containing protein n=1 Tax=uncultured Nisaea sp. TaxID=538215 RepID=UPI0030EBE10C
MAKDPVRASASASTNLKQNPLDALERKVLPGDENAEDRQRTNDLLHTGSNKEQIAKGSEREDEGASRPDALDLAEGGAGRSGSASPRTAGGRPAAASSSVEGVSINSPDASATSTEQTTAREFQDGNILGRPDSAPPSEQGTSSSSRQRGTTGSGSGGSASGPGTGEDSGGTPGGGIAGESSLQAPDLTTSNADGLEDTAIELNLSVSDDTSSVTISGIPEGAVLSAGTPNADGSWTLTPDQLDGLTITPPADFSGDIDLTVTATTIDESGNTATTTDSLTVTVEAVADAPVLAVTPASGTEDSPIALDLDARLTDLDGSESLEITISGIPDGAVLSAGTVNADGSVTLTGDQLGGLTITPPEDFSGEIVLAVTAIATDENGDTAETALSLPVTVTAIADAPVLAVSDAAGLEDNAITLDLSTSITDDSESVSLTITGIPEGAVLSAGTVNVDGSVTLTDDQLDGLTITPPADFSGEFALEVTASSIDENGDTATTTDSLTVTVEAVADAPVLTVRPASGTEDSPIALDISTSSSDADGSETVSVTITGIPDGATLSAGTVNDDGNVTLTPDQLVDLTITAPENFSGDIALTVVSTSVDENGDTAETSLSLPVTVTAIADAPVLAVSDAAGLEDNAIALDLSASVTDDSESVSLTITNIPEGAVLSAGTVNADGSVTLTPGQLAGLTITPPEDFSGAIDLTVTATTTEANGDTATTTDSLTVTVAAVADAPTLVANDVTGSEDSPI